MKFIDDFNLVELVLYSLKSYKKKIIIFVKEILEIILQIGNDFKIDMENKYI